MGANEGAVGIQPQVEVSPGIESIVNLEYWKDPVVETLRRSGPDLNRWSGFLLSRCLFFNFLPSALSTI